MVENLKYFLFTEEVGHSKETVSTKNSELKTWSLNKNIQLIFITMFISFKN